MPDDAPVTKTVCDIDSPEDYDLVPAVPTTSSAEPTRFRNAARQHYRHRNLLQSPGRTGPRAVRQPRPVGPALASRRRLRHDDLVQQRRDDRRPPARCRALLALDDSRGRAEAVDRDLQSRCGRLAYELPRRVAGCAAG